MKPTKEQWENIKAASAQIVGACNSGLSSNGHVNVMTESLNIIRTLATAIYNLDEPL